MTTPIASQPPYVGRLAPTPSGWLHRGHAFTFGVAFHRARTELNGRLWLRIEDVDRVRCKPHFVQGILEDLQWLGISWDANLNVPDGFVQQSQQRELYQEQLLAWARAGWIYPSTVSRKQLRENAEVQRGAMDETIFPPQWRQEPYGPDWTPRPEGSDFRINWRWKVPDGMEVVFDDQRLGRQCWVAGRDFGDFLVWSRDGMPAYEMAVVLDDIASGVTEVVRGEDLLLSTARQLLIYEAMKQTPPLWYHCPLVRDEKGVRLAKSYDSESIRSYRKRGWKPADFWMEMHKMGMPEVAESLARGCDGGKEGSRKSN